jgi:prevent-host-death family protein
MEVSIHEAKPQLSQLLRRVAAGEEVVIARAGKPVAKLVPIFDAGARVLGCDAGRFTVPDDFDAPLDDATLASFEGCGS